MGTNYYLNKEVCGHCGRGDGPLHIGKSSMGWYFALHVDPENGIKDLEDWEKLFRDPKNKIEDEYGRPLTTDEMISEINNRQGHVSPESYGFEETLKSNGAIFVPERKLFRRRPDRSHCIGVGSGTWDMCIGEFS